MTSTRWLASSIAMALFGLLQAGPALASPDSSTSTPPPVARAATGAQKASAPPAKSSAAPSAPARSRAAVRARIEAIDPSAWLERWGPVERRPLRP